MTFEEVYESYCLMLEQPHIEIGNKVFDLEVEEFKGNLNGLVARLSNVLNLIPVPNSVNRSHKDFVFDNKRDTEQYWYELKNSFIFRNMIKFMFQLNVDEIAKLVGK
jgi:hypothetical protein